MLKASSSSVGPKQREISRESRRTASNGPHKPIARAPSAATKTTVKPPAKKTTAQQLVGSKQLSASSGAGQRLKSS